MRHKDRNWESERRKAIQKKIKRQKRNNERVIQNDRSRGPLLRIRRIKSCGTERNYQRMREGKMEEKDMYGCGAVLNCRALWVICKGLFPTTEAS